MYFTPQQPDPLVWQGFGLFGAIGVAYGINYAAHHWPTQGCLAALRAGLKGCRDRMVGLLAPTAPSASGTSFSAFVPGELLASETPGHKSLASALAGESPDSQPACPLLAPAPSRALSAPGGVNLATQVQRDQQILQQVLVGTATATGVAFFGALAENIAMAVGVSHVFLSEVTGANPYQVNPQGDIQANVLASWPPLGEADSNRLVVTGTPCGQVLATGQPQYYLQGVQAAFPQADAIQRIQAQGYLGVPLKDGEGEILGVLCICHRHPITDSQRKTALMLLGFFASKAAAELQRQRVERSLHQSYDELEQRVEERTAALAKANDHLRRLASQARTTAAIIQQVRCSLDLNVIFTTTTAELRRALGCDRVLVYRFKPDWSGYIVAETVTKDWQPCLGKQEDQVPLPWLRRTLESDHCAVRLHDDGDNHFRDTHLQATQGGAYIQSTDYLQVDDVSNANFSPCYRELLESLQAQAYLTVPIYVGHHLWGLLAHYQNDGPRQWDAEDVQMAVQVGSQLGVAIQQTELFNQTQQQAAELQRAKEVADAANRAKTDFLASMSHELRTPLNAILGFTQLMGHDASLSPRHRQYVDIVNNSGAHLLALINDILEMSKIEAGRLDRVDTDFQLAPFLENLQAMLGLKAQQKHLAFYLERSPQLPAVICADQNKLRQVLLNLLGNAIKFTNTGYVRLRVQALCDPTATVTPTPCTLRLEIEDTGPGIHPSEMSRLFEAFQQTQTGLQSGQGSGLGLSISQRYVQLMGGELTVSSNVGQGTRFTVVLPVLAQPGLAPDAPQGDRPPMPVALSPRDGVASEPGPLWLPPCSEPYRILVAEDNHTNRLLLREYLTPLGVEIEEAVDGEAAVALWWRWRPHLIWMDMRMPHMDGRTATRRIRQMEANLGLDPTVIVALTATAFEEQQQEILAAGCNAVIAKPFQAEHLLGVLQQYLACPSFAAEPSQAQPPEPLPPLASTDIQVMPPTWIQALHQAACEGNDTKVIALLQEMPAAQVGAAQVLSHLATVFQFDRIIAITLPLLSPSESLSGGTPLWTTPLPQA